MAEVREEFENVDEKEQIKTDMGLLIGSALIVNAAGNMFGERKFTYKSELLSVATTGDAFIVLKNATDIQAGETLLLTGQVLDYSDATVGREYVVVDSVAADKQTVNIVGVLANTYAIGDDVDIVFASEWIDSTIPTIDRVEDKVKEQVYPRLK